MGFGKFTNVVTYAGHGKISMQEARTPNWAGNQFAGRDSVDEVIRKF